MADTTTIDTKYDDMSDEELAEKIAACAKIFREDRLAYVDRHLYDMSHNLKTLAIARNSISTNSRLLRLPAELRDRIFALAIPAVGIINLKSKHISIVDNKIEEPGLLRVCHQLRAETRTLYYSRQVVHIRVGEPDVSIILLERILSRFNDRLELVRSIEIILPVGDHWNQPFETVFRVTGKTFSAITPFSGDRCVEMFMEVIEVVKKYRSDIAPPLKRAALVIKDKMSGGRDMWLEPRADGTWEQRW